MKVVLPLTGAFSKKFGNFRAAVALHHAYYDFGKFDSVARARQQMVAGVENSAWTVRDLVARVNG